MVMRIGARLSKIMFCNEKLVDLFLLIPRAPLLRVSNRVDLTYSHAWKMMKLWDSMGLIVMNKAGYRYNIFYTERGKRLAEQLTNLRRYLKRAKIQFDGDEQ
jgi:hypothetical protein